jgi:glycosyltransferase involved in cell wall biosynthesis
VAEAMFWGCLPITSKVSCIPYMLANGERGALVNANADEIVAVVEDYLSNPEKYRQQIAKAMEWSRQFTMEKFEEGIRKLIDN